MDCIEILLAAFCATTAMTAFSYMISAGFRKLYKEPVLLEILMSAFHIELSAQEKQLRAWALHYFVGIVFVVIYYLPACIDHSWYGINIQSGLIFGAIAGTVGIVWWKTMFLFSGKSAMIEPSGYYIQLFAAHLIFALTVVGVHFLFLQI